MTIPIIRIIKDILYLTKFGATSDDWKILLQLFTQSITEEFQSSMKLNVPSVSELSVITMYLLIITINY